MRIDACFDSHVHWYGAGEIATRVNLASLKSPEELNQELIKNSHARGDWILGFGWDDNKWTEKPNRHHIDKIIPDKPAAFLRCDAHALWVNTEALKRAGLLNKNLPEIAGGRIEVGADGLPTGLLVDHARMPIDRLIPPLTALEMRRHLLRGVKNFNDNGYTHIRDMTCDELQWNEAVRLDESGLLTLAVEEYFWLKGHDELDKVLSLALKAREVKSPNLRVKGLKLFLDGALGSEGAWLSRCYHGSDKKGLMLWEREALRETLIKIWEHDFEPALHAIGDEAADWLVDLAVELKDAGHTGRFHIEHAEILRPETVAKMKALDVHCHLQPAHWLSDRRWLRDKVGDLAEHAFPWRRLQEAEIAFDFGSDAPIEPASVGRIFQALTESAEAGIPRLLGGPIKYMGHRDLSWAPNSFSQFAGDRAVQVVFRGEDLL